MRKTLISQDISEQTSLVLQLLQSRRYDLLEEIQVFNFSFYKLSASFYDMFPKFRFIECNIDESVCNGYSTAICYLYLDQLWISLLSSVFCKKKLFFNKGRKLHLSLYIKDEHLENGWELYQSRNIVLVVSSLAPMTSPVGQRNSFTVLGMNYLVLRILGPIWQVLVALEI